MILESLPDELLVMVIRRLPIRDRFMMRKTSRMFHELVDSVGILPRDCHTIFIDFVNQAVVVEFGDNYEQSAVGNLNLVEKWRQDRRLHLNPLFNRPFRAFCDVAESWKGFVGQYVHKLNRLYHQKKIVKCFLHVELSTIEVPLPLLDLSVNFQKVLVHPRSRFYNIPLPKTLEYWLTEFTTPQIQLDYLVSPSQIDQISAPIFSCFVNDECAVHLLNKFSNDALPELTLWIMEIRYSRPDRLIEELETRYALPPGSRPRGFVRRNLTTDLEFLQASKRADSGYYMFLRKSG